MRAGRSVFLMTIVVALLFSTIGKAEEKVLNIYSWPEYFQQFPLCPEPKETRGAQHSGFANFAPFYGDCKLATV